MREVVEFRIPEELAQEFLPPSVGLTLGDSVRKVAVGTSDAMFQRIEKLSRDFRAKGDYFFYGHQFRRYYSAEEISSARLFLAEPKKTFEPAGEECGTSYDDSKACSRCGSGAAQSSDLHLNSKSIPQGMDLSRTIAGELVISARFVQVIQRSKLTGADIAPIILSDKRGRPSAEFYQLKLQVPLIEIDPLTRGGEDPFDHDSYGACTCGNLLGLNRLSEVSVRTTGGPIQDFMTTRQCFGHRLGLLRPNRVLLLSPNGYRVTVEEKLRGLKTEVAHWI